MALVSFCKVLFWYDLIKCVFPMGAPKILTSFRASSCSIPPQYWLRELVKEDAWGKRDME